MKPFIQRTVSEIGRDGLVADRQHVSIEDYHATAAWILLGDAGSGKTRQFRYEVERSNARGEYAQYVTARDFVTFEGSQPHWKNATLFIDALDEVRATKQSSRWYFDLLRRYINQLGKPKFRIACRDAHWLGDTDQDHLSTVSADYKLTILRLDDLQDAQVRTYLSTYGNVGNVEAFIEEATHHRVEALLTNPQNLDMMAQVVTPDHKWPTNRFELYSSLCSRMTLETNPQHGIPNPSRPSPAEALDAAGQICSLQLLTDRDDCITATANPRLESLSINDFRSQPPELISHTLATKLFRTSSHGGRTPVHRSIAEFLAARHLAQLIKHGLPVQRVLALISGADGIVITPFRGLSAWLATHSTASRTAIIQRDPIGVALYADLTCFSTKHKAILLHALFKHIDSQIDSRAIAIVYARAISPDDSFLLQEILKSRDSSTSHLRIVHIVLEMLSNTPHADPYTEILTEMTSDNDRPYGVKIHALRALIKIHRKRPQDATSLVNVLRQARDQVLHDPDGDLTGELLSYLYPKYLPPDSVLEYLHDQANDRYWGQYCIFWAREIVEQSEINDAVTVLNLLAANFEYYYTSIRRYSLYDLPFRLLLCALPVCTNVKYYDYLYSWLQVTSSIAKRHPTRASEEKLQIQHWIEAHPKVAMYLIDREFTDLFGRDKKGVRVSTSGKILMDSIPPREFGRWCLSKALTAPKALSVSLLLQSYGEYAVHKRSYGLTLEQIQDVANRIGYTRPLAQEFADQRTRHDSVQSERKELRKWVGQIRNDIGSLSEESRNTHILHIVGRAYFGLIHELDDVEEIAGVRELLEWDVQLMTLVELSLRQVMQRNDLPSVEEIGGLFGEQKRHVLGLPFLACIDHALRDGSIDIRTLSPHQIGRAVAFYYAEPYLPAPSARFRLLLNAAPETTIGVLTRMTLIDVRSRRHAPWKAWAIVGLLADPDAARRASFEIISRYPLRCTSLQVEALDHHFWATLSPEYQVLETVASRRLSQASLNLGQRVRWLFVSILFNPESLIHEFEQFIVASPQRVTHLATFLCTIANTDYEQLFVWLRRLDDASQLDMVSVMVRIFGQYSTPADQTRSGRVDSKINMSQLVLLLIRFLSSIPTHAASDVLGDLCGDPTLWEWESSLCFYRDHQSSIARDAQFTYPTVRVVDQVLSGGSPANPADLHALVVDQLIRIGQSYRVDQANLWRRFWNEDSHGKPRTPKAEDSCRDSLLADLRDCLPPISDVTGEALFVHRNRADILVKYRCSAVPIEIKVASSKSVWVGLRDQLIEKYGRHQSTWGYGIYVVLWFGSFGTSTPDGESTSADLVEIRSEVVRRARLSDSERRKIEVVVLDLSVPRISGDADLGSLRAAHVEI